MKKKFVILLAALTLMSLLAACGEDQKQDTAETASTPTSVAETVKPTAAETTAVISVETTASGGTIEKTADHYTVERDKNGAIISVADSDGNAVSVEEYSERHASGSGTQSDGASSQTPSKPSADSDTPQDEPAASSKSDTEEDIPQVIVEIPEDEYELPILK